jgi:hypothetical protein
MMSLNLKNVLSLLVLGFVLGLFSSFLIPGCNKSSISKTEGAIKPKELKKQADTIQGNYQKQIADLQDQTIELMQNLEVAQGLLDQQKQICQQKEQQIKKLTEPKGYPAKALLSKVDTSNFISDCDSLATVVNDYIEENYRKDTIYETQLTQMDSVITVKDDLIQTNRQAYTNLHQLFDQSLVTQQSLIKQNKQLQRQFKRQRFKSKVVTVGLMILTAAATNYLLHH